MRYLVVFLLLGCGRAKYEPLPKVRNCYYDNVLCCYGCEKEEFGDVYFYCKE